MSEVRLRPMRWWDVERVLPLEVQLFPDDPWTAEGFWAELAQHDSRHYVLAESHGGSDSPSEEPLGYAGLMAVGATADVQTVAVAPAAQGNGLGRVLLDHLLGEAVQRGCREVLLEVRADNAPAQSLYARAGFERIGVRRGYYDGGRTDALVLRRRVGGRDD
ncbi:MAG: ribosomal protein S18-alanine N-acetyltransferase [Motilibacteraceae bacterium]